MISSPTPIPSSHQPMTNNITPKDFAQRLITWYHLNARPLPWRKQSTPYKIWLSEIILQQTKVNQGLPYYKRFIETFPTLQDLAHATQEQVLRLWQGLGYYRRGINLLRCAKEITIKHQGKFPTNYHKLCTLPGIGPYTGAAIASIAFKEPVAAVDGNVYRVLARIFGITDNIQTTKAQKKFKKLAQSLLDPKQPHLFNQALMEFGALHCTPKQPKCHHCPFKNLCQAKQQKLQHKLPIKTKKAPHKNRYFHYLILTHNNTIYLKKRAHKDIWQGLYDFYLIEKDRFYPFDDLQDNLVTQIKNRQHPVRKLSPHYKHILTHQKIHAAFFHIQIDKSTAQASPQKNLTPFTPSQIPELPLPILIAKLLKHRPSLLTHKKASNEVEVYPTTHAQTDDSAAYYTS